MDSTNRRLEQVRGLLHDPPTRTSVAALAELLASWPDEDEAGGEIARQQARERVARWIDELRATSAALERHFPAWTESHPVGVSVRMCGGDTERKVPVSDDEYVSAVFFGSPNRFDAVCVEPRAARPPDPGEPPDGVIWLIEPPRAEH